MTLGRPREFNTDKALDEALTIFRKNGYDGTTMLDLTEAMGINRPSLYVAFGNKEALFHKVLDRYEEKHFGFIAEAFQLPTSRAVVERLLHGFADVHTDPDKPHGCLTVHGALATGESTESVRLELNRRREAGETAIRQRLERGRAEGELPAHVDPANWAKYITAVANGMAVMAAAGETRDALHRLAEITMQAWPD